MGKARRQIGKPTPGVVPWPAPAGLARAAGKALLILLALLAPQLPAHAQEVEVLLPEKECQVKYAMLYSFGLLTTWPAEAYGGDGEPFVIGVLGAKPFPEYLARIAEKKSIQGRKIAIRRFASADDVGRCQILYLTNALAGEEEEAAVKKLAKRPILVVSERPPEAGPSAAPIQFIIEQGVVRFLLNAEAAKARQLQFDPRLLNLAKRTP